MRSCQKKYYWNYIEGLRPVRKTASLSLGSVIHEAFDWFYKGASSFEVLKSIHTTMDIQIDKAPLEDVEDLMIARYILTGMWNSFPFKITTFTDFKKIEPEMEFKVKVPRMRGVLFVGKVDGLVTDNNGLMWIRELKTTSQPFSQFELRCRQSSQGTGYIWALRQLGYPVQGVVYDYIKKPLLRKGVNETVDDYGKRIVLDYASRPDVYYKRHPSYRTDEEIAMFEKDLRQVAYDIRQKGRENSWHRNTDQCWNYNSECPYLKICFKEKPDPLTLQIYFENKPTLNKGVADGRTSGSTGGGGNRGGVTGGEIDFTNGSRENL